MFHPHRPKILVGGRRLLASAVFFFVCTALIAGSRAVFAQEVVEVDIPDVARLEIRGGVEVELSQGEPALLARGSREDLDKVPYAATSRGLVLGYSRKHRRDTFSEVKFRVTLPSISEVHVMGSGTMYLRSFDVQDLRVTVAGSGDARLHNLRGDSLALRVSGSGDIQVATADVDALEAVIAGSGDILLGSLRADTADIVVQGSGDMRVETSTQLDTLELSIVGAGSVDLEGVPARRAEVNIVGSGDARLGELQEKLDVSILGSGNVLYAGDAEKSTRILGSGRISRRDE
ncbi:MAG: GIN domain-containing protein [Chromatocurvus sp.]